MPERIKRVRRRRRSHSLPGVESYPSLRFHFPPLRVAIYVALGVIALVLIIVFGAYGSKLYTGWRESRLLKHASERLEKKDFVDANRLARQVLELHHDSLPAFYILADATEKQNSEETVSWRAQIARLQPENIDAQLNLASAALRFGQIDLARKTLEQIGPRAQDRAPFHVVAGWLARAEGNVAEQEQNFDIAVQRDPKNDLYQFNLAAIRIRSPDPIKNTQAREMLDRLTQVPEFRSGALRALLNDAVDRKDLETADRFAQQLQMSSDVTFSDYLLCLNFYRKLDAKKFDALLEKVKPVAARTSTDLGLLMDWMNENGMASEVIKWMEKLPADATDHPPPAIAVAASFAELKNWSRLRRWTRSESWGNDDYLRLAYQGFAAHQARQSSADAEFDTLWREALHVASDRPDHELKLARLASKWNLAIESEELWSRLSRNPPTRREALDALYKLYRASNNLRKLYDVLQRLHDSSPNDIWISTNLARLGLNIDENTKQAQDLAKQAYDHSPEDVDCAVTYAFSLYVQGRTTEGLDVIRKLPPEAMRESHNAVYAAILLLDVNQADAAKEYIQIAKRGPLDVEEKRLLEDEHAKASGATPGPTPNASAMPAPGARPSAAPTGSMAPSPSASPTATRWGRI
ncbi:MAG TPA: tetratricopeptide repeat protein [Chthoniobacterales bacterium]|jgi:thioredoxin-like negative regulator of GroEL|nr:tetratricopeptide repeat protein [Chthoniobacterales bacterium]